MIHFKTLYTPISWAFYSLTGFITAVFISWLLLAKADFAYPVLHHVLDIQQHSQKYGPQNRYRQDFQFTNQTEHVRLFSAINIAIHNKGKGLKDIQYRLPSGKVVNSLLHRKEIIHLRDVANLIDKLKYTGLLISVSWLIMSLFYFFAQHPFPNLRQQSISMTAVIFLCSLSIMIIGPVKVFYQMHDWVFPDNHQWFFYYQESLMTILMKAPDLFGGIAILITVLAICIFIFLNYLMLFVRKKKAHK